jgi:tripartite-type tricarboxylate transporter receptor subunit TctC
MDRRQVLGALGALPFASTASLAQSWPSQPLKIIVSQAAGGTPDILCRLVMGAVEKVIGQNIVVENKPGAANMIAAQTVARAAPDGYTLFWATAAALVTNPHTFKTLTYDPQKDFAPVGKVADGPFLLLAHPSLPVKSLPDLIAYAKANPGKLSIATDGARNFSGLIAAWINKLAGTDIQMVPYTNMPQGVQDTLAGRVQLVIIAIPSAAGFVRDKSLIPIAISTKARAPGYEDITPIAETFPGFDFSGWMSVVAPANTPEPIVQQLNRAMDSVLKQPEIAGKLREIGFFTTGAGTTAETAAFIKAQYDAFGRVVQDIGLQPE